MPDKDQHSGAPSAVDDAEILPPGTVLGGFELRESIARGGMAVVYRGIQLSLARPVAVKVLAARLASDPRFVQRFNHEAGALAGLSHPNIVNIIDKGVADGHYYFAMELVEGITLAQLLHAVELTPRHYTHVISEVAKALAYVHAHGVIHRDIKPGNILVNRHGVVKVADFGIAHIAEGDEHHGSGGATVGTAQYMAPEQRADSSAADARSDIYSLGVTFYRMFTRELPGEKPLPPSQINPSLPEGVDAPIARALSPDRQDRYRAVSEFSEDLLSAFRAPGGQDGVRRRSADLPADPIAAARAALAAEPGTGAGESTASALFRPLFVAGGASGATTVPVIAGAPQPSSSVVEDDPPPVKPLLRSPIFWVVVAVVVLLSLAAALGVLFALFGEYL